MVLEARARRAAAETLAPSPVQAPCGRRRAARSGARLKAARRGRAIGSRRGTLRQGARLDLVATLRAAAPWQALRRSGLEPEVERRIVVHEDDYRIVRYRQRTGSTTVFAVDASVRRRLHGWPRPRVR